jgi:hypothetical protein
MLRLTVCAPDRAIIATRAINGVPAPEAIRIARNGSSLA